MNAVDLLLPEPEVTEPFSVRLAHRRAIAIVPKPSDRRAHARRAAHELLWLQAIRLSGCAAGEARLIDISEGGALLEFYTPMRPGMRLRLDLVGENVDARVPLELVRCYVSRLEGASTIYRGACSFTNPIVLPDAARQPLPAHEDFVGMSAALGYLLDRCRIDDERGQAGSPARRSFERVQLLHVLESLRARGAGERSNNDIARNPSLHTVGLIETVLPALHRGDARQDVAALLERQLTALPPSIQSEMHAASSHLAALIEHCTAPRVDDPLAAAAPVVDERKAEAAAPVSPAANASALQKIVVRFADGQLLKGFTQDFHPTRPQFSLWPGVSSTPSERVVVPLQKLKAVFFVKDFDGNPSYRERKSFIKKGQGRRVEVTFLDSETILGTTLNYRPDGFGFFVHPADSGTNNSRIFAINKAVRRVQFL